VDHAAALIEQNSALGDTVRGADWSAPVPTCPDWTIRQLVPHVGRGDRWAAAIVEQRSDTYVDTRSVPDGKPPADVEGALTWLQAGARQLLDAVAASGPATEVWTFTGPKPSAWWIRRRLHEATVHRADAAIAAGVPYELAPGLAADGVSEWLGLLAARKADPAPLDPGVTLHLHATDEGLAEQGEWLIRGGEGGVTWEHGHGKGAAAVRGGAADLLLAVLRRAPADAEPLQVLGDAGVWHTWLERTGF
jgi:uncharacterized protein (TIGR03083 family)